MKKFTLLTLGISCTLIVLSIILLVIFKISNFTNMYAAYIVGLSAILGGAGLILSATILFFRNDLARIISEKLSFHLPEIIAVGLLVIGFGVILLWGKVIK